MSEAYRLKLLERLAAPSLNDIPGRLRELADRIERGTVITDKIMLIFDDEATDDMAITAFGKYTPEEAYFRLGLAMRRLEGAI